MRCPFGWTKQSSFSKRTVEVVVSLITHGPYGSPSGALVLLRSIGGPMTTTIEPKVKHTYTPDHNPILPDYLKDKGKKQVPKIARY